jgi:hypothetical protein
MKIEKETLQRYKAQLSTRGLVYDKILSVNQQRQVVEYCLELIDAADGGPDIQKLRQELAEKENQLQLILTDIQESLPGIAYSYIITPGVEKARYLAELGLRYLRSRKTKDFQSWKDYRVMVDEEFSA